MGPRVDFLQLLDADFGVNLGGFQFGVSQQLLDKTGVGTAFEHVRGAGVPEEMTTSLATNVGLLDVSGHFSA